MLRLPRLAIAAACLAASGAASPAADGDPLLPKFAAPVIVQTGEKPQEKKTAHLTEEFDIDSLPNPETTTDSSKCVAVGVEPAWEVRDRLKKYETVYRKAAIKWTPENYERLIGLARACNDTLVGTEVVNGNSWTSMIMAAYEAVMPVAQLADKVDEYGSRLGAKAIKLPPCPVFLDYKKDDWAMTDNSAQLLGTDFMKLDGADLDKVTNYANQCLIYLPDYGYAARSVRPNDSAAVLDAVMDRTLLLKKRREDYAAWPHAEYDLHVYRNGTEVPPSLASGMAREMVQRFNKMAESGRRFTPEMVEMMLRLSDDVITANKTALDKELAEEVRRRVQEHIFRRQ